LLITLPNTVTPITPPIDLKKACAEVTVAICVLSTAF
jgi:hypothetical protein